MRRRRPRVIRRKPRVRRGISRRVPVGVSRQHYAKLLYCDLDSSSVPVTSYVTWGYQSSLFDPYVALGGHQPMFFDQYAAMYRRYTVMGIAYQLEVVIDQASSGPLFVTVTPSGVGVSSTTLSVARERPGTRECCVTTSNRGRMKGYMSVAKLLGVNRRKLLTDDQYSAAVTANPSQMCYLGLQAWNPSGTAAIIAHVSLRLIYYCRFYDPTDPGQS